MDIFQRKGRDGISRSSSTKPKIALGRPERGDQRPSEVLLANSVTPRCFSWSACCGKAKLRRPAGIGNCPDRPAGNEEGGGRRLAGVIERGTDHGRWVGGRGRAAPRQFFAAGSGVGRTDGQLLECFAAVARRGEPAAETALETILAPRAAVLAVCRQVLGDGHVAEDAFQATFLVLVRLAGSPRIREAGTLGGWLQGVAYRTALKARRGAARRQARELRGRAGVPGRPGGRRREGGRTGRGPARRGRPAAARYRSPRCRPMSYRMA